MTKNILLYLFLFINSIAYSQDWCHWTFDFKFKLDVTETIRYNFKNFELFINESYNYENYQNSSIELDSLTQEYRVTITYGCISCGYPNCDKPPEVYLKINLDNRHPYEKLFSTFIPNYFKANKHWETNEPQHDKIIDIGTIKIENFLTDDLWKDKIERYEVIEIIAPNSIYYRKNGEYSPRRMNKMIKIK